MKSRIYFVLLLILIAKWVVCQPLAGMKVYDTPGKFANPKQGMDLTIGDPNKVNNFSTTTWIVFSDRDNNQSYTEPNGREVKKEIGFLEQFYVVDEKGQYLHIVKDPAIEGKRLSANAMDYGWIKKENLLLWNKAIKNERNIDRKALIINKIDTIENISDQEFEESKVVFSSSPATDIETDNKPSDFQIFYVYKIQEDMVLLGKCGMVSNPSDVKSIIQGWVPKSRVMFWESRFALEPNWLLRAIEEREFKGIEASILINKPSALTFQINPYSVEKQKVIWKEGKNRQRRNGYWMRLPILEKNEYGIYKVGVLKKNITRVGFSTFKVNSLKHPLFKTVILMSRNELFNLIQIFDNLINAYNSSDQRNAIRNTWLELLKANLNKNEQTYLDMDLNAINNKVTGIEKYNETLMCFKLKDITNRKVFSDKEFNRYVSNITSKHYKLDRVGQNDEYKFMFTSNGIKYYWLPIEYIP